MVLCYNSNRLVILARNGPEKAVVFSELRTSIKECSSFFYEYRLKIGKKNTLPT